MKDDLLTALDQVWEGEDAINPLGVTLAGIRSEQAVFSPKPGVHSIVEIVNHTAFWTEYWLRQIEGKPLDDLLPYPGDGEAPPGMPTEWVAARDNLIRLRERIREGISRLSDEEVIAPLPQCGMSCADLVRTEVAHEAFHCGQIVLMLELQKP
jgi:uncharacterized damage-inducible protein DinB